MPEAYGQTPQDSLYHIREVVVTGRVVRREVIPVQELSGERLQRLNSHNVADALRYFSGIQIKDYGGVGGLKTVNIRSMGTNTSGSSTTVSNWATLKTARSIWGASRSTTWSR